MREVRLDTLEHCPGGLLAELCLAVLPGPLVLPAAEG